MKKIVLSLLALVFTFAVTSCRDAEKKADENMEEEAEMILEETEDMEEASYEEAADLETMTEE